MWHEAPPVEVDPANEKEHVLRHPERPLLSEARDGFDWDNAEAYRANRNRSTGRVRWAFIGMCNDRLHIAVVEELGTEAYSAFDAQTSMKGSAMSMTRKAIFDEANRDDTVTLDDSFEHVGKLPHDHPLLQSLRAARKRGRPRHGAEPKVVVSMRLDPETLARWRATGRGWQARAAEVLRKAIA
jgi:uncharacterized protein (DUF4415 family)